jgi:hypothetical protein
MKGRPAGADDRDSKSEARNTDRFRSPLNGPLRGPSVASGPKGWPGTVPTWAVPLLLTLYVIAGATLAFRYRYAITPDATAYIDIARDYASGHWADAVNGLWSPLYSLLLAVPIRAGVDPLLAGQLIQVLVGVAALLAVRALLSRLQVAPPVALVTLGALTVVTLSWTVGGVGPDLLPVALCVCYLRLVLDAGPRHPVVALASGLVAGLGFLAKASFLPFFAVVTVAVVILRLSRGEAWRTQWIRAAAAVLGFAVLVLPWVLALSTKYERPTFGAAATYNLAIIGPGFDSLSVAHPQDTAGLLAPPNPRATSVWTDPTRMPLPVWTPLSAAGFVHELRNIGLNVAESMNWLLRFWLLAPAVLIWGLSRFWARSHQRFREEVQILTVAVLTLIGIYLPWLVESRYLWPAFMLIVVLGASWWTTRYHGGARLWPAASTLVVAVILLLAQPLHHLVPGDSAYGREPLDTARVLRGLGVGGNIASDQSSAWSHDLYVSYHLNAHYYGVVAPAASDQQRTRQLREDHIDYVLVHSPVTPSYLGGFVSIGRVPEASLTVFRRIL